MRKLYARTSGCGLDARRREIYIYYTYNNISRDYVQTRFDFLARQNVERYNKEEKKNRLFSFSFLFIRKTLIMLYDIRQHINTPRCKLWNSRIRTRITRNILDIKTYITFTIKIQIPNTSSATFQYNYIYTVAIYQRSHKDVKDTVVNCITRVTALAPFSEGQRRSGTDLCANSGPENIANNFTRPV